jgi:hypothetical protein
MITQPERFFLVRGCWAGERRSWIAKGTVDIGLVDWLLFGSNM